MTSRQLLVICVNYNSDQDTLSLTRDFLGQKSDQEIHVLIADNTSREQLQKTLEIPSDWKNNVTVFSTGGNLGYFGAAAKALDHYLALNPLPTWIAVSNADLSVPATDFVARLTLMGEKVPSGIIAPSIQSSVTGRDQNPYMLVRPSIGRMHFYKLIFRSTVLSFIYTWMSNLKRSLKTFKLHTSRKHGEGPQGSELAPQHIYAPHGSFILFNHSYFRRGGTLNHGTFLYGEEIFVAETAKKLELPVFYEPSLRVVHREHATTGRVKSVVLFKYRKDAAKYLADTFF